MKIFLKGRLSQVLILSFFVSGTAWGGDKCSRLAPNNLFVETMLTEAGTGTVEKRVAFVLGNEQYAPDVGPLKNPVADATAIARRLQSLGFEVFLATDATGSEIESCVTRVRGALAGADLGLFFYAGHGFQADDRNYAVAVDAAVDLSSEQGLVAIEPIVGGFRDAARANVFILDACRTTPWAETGRAGLSAGSLGRSLARGAKLLEEALTAANQANVYLAYATSPNATAADGNGRHSPFTQALLEHLGEPGHSLSRVMSSVKNSVGEATDWSQTPWTRSSLPAPIHFNGWQTLPELTTASEKLAGNAREHAARGEFQDALATALKALPSGMKGDAPGREFRAAQAALYNSLRQRPIKLPIQRTEEAIASADGRHVFTASSTYVQLGRQIDVWNVATGQKVAVLGRGRPDHKNAGIVAWDQSSGGDIVAAVTADAMIELWESTTGRLRRQWPLEPPDAEIGIRVPPTSGFIAFGPSDAYLVSTGSKGLKLWDAKSSALVRTYTLPETKRELPKILDMSGDSSEMIEQLKELAGLPTEFTDKMSDYLGGTMASFLIFPKISPDKKVVATATANKIIIWSLESGELQWELTGPKQWSLQDPTIFAWWGFDRAGKYVGAVNSKGAWLWDARTGEILFDWPYDGGLFQGSISPDGRIFALRSTTAAWEYRSTETGEVIVEPPVVDTIARPLIISPSGEVTGELVNPDFADWKRGPTGESLIAAALAELDDSRRAQVVRDRFKYWPLSR